MIFELLKILGGGALVLGYYSQLRQTYMTKQVVGINKELHKKLFLGFGLLELHLILSIADGQTGQAISLIINTMLWILSGAMARLVQKYENRKYFY